MSVTFSVYANGKFVEPDGFEYTYEDDPIYGRIQTNQNPLEMNVANGNFVRLMDLIGQPSDDYCGTWKGGDLLRIKGQVDFILCSLKSMPEMDGGVVGEIQRGQGGCTIVDCGLREGYFTERLETLREILWKAVCVGGVVTFG